MTLCKGERHMVIFNPCRGKGRQSNDIMHELSHIIIGHKAQCQWMSLDAGQVLGTKIDEPVKAITPVVHLKVDKNLTARAAKALSSMIIAANGCFCD